VRAVIIEDFNAKPEVTDVPVPRPREGEVLVKINTSSVNGLDEAIAGGSFKGAMEHRFPVVLGMDFAGTVSADGADFHEGDAVFGVIVGSELGPGAFAEYAAVDASHCVARIPDGLERADAGALGLSGIAALDSVDAVDPKPGEKVFISGAVTGDGAFAVQMVAARGAEVIVTANPGRETDFVRGLGASRVVRHVVSPAGTAGAAGITGATGADGAGTNGSPAGRSSSNGGPGGGPTTGAGGDASDEVADGGMTGFTDEPSEPEPASEAASLGGIDAVLHFAGDAMALGALLRPGGRFASTLGASPGRADVERFAIRPRVSREALEMLAAEVVAGKLVVPVTRTYKLAEAAQALRDYRSGALGKYAIEVSS
jgi:NADPH:quinone reductase-like Zn-dependent oxidoreductase